MFVIYSEVMNSRGLNKIGCKFIWIILRPISSWIIQIWSDISKLGYVYSLAASQLSSYLNKLFSDFPTKYTRISFSQIFYAIFHFSGRYLWFWTPDDAWSDGTGFLVSVEYLWNTSMWNSKLSTYHTRPYTRCSQLDDFSSNVIR